MQNNNYYQYYIGNMVIENPIVIEIKDQDDMWYVCSDSILYCCHDSNWLYRDDVFPYLPIADNNSTFLTYYPRKKLSHYTYFQVGYIPFYEYGNISNHTIYKFYYGINSFECYMQTTEECRYMSFDDIDLINDKSNYDNINDFNAKLIYQRKYRMVVRQKYNIFQILQLKRKYKFYFESDH